MNPSRLGRCTIRTLLRLHGNQSLRRCMDSSLAGESSAATESFHRIGSGQQPIGFLSGQIQLAPTHSLDRHLAKGLGLDRNLPESEGSAWKGGLAQY